MKRTSQNILKCFATVFTVAILFMSCEDQYKRVGEEAVKPIFPQGVAQNFTLTYTETVEAMSSQDSANSRVIAVLTSPISEDFDNQSFKFRTFPKGLKVDFFDEKNQKSVISADYGIVYSQTNLIDLRGNVVIESYDGKKLETDQLYFDRKNNWIFTEAAFTYTNPDDGTVMDGEGMDFNKDFSFFKANKTFGLMTIKEEEGEQQ
ncbi:LPS export ABC transporter periplasmic protein LptC [Flagellimonas aequoris]|uniref:LPS export ABC transporter periplasmic protein LptC n=1 Tax=Flagellimonas aequoris TaxID=2306997 RepID=A0A418N6S9_9FLAO|nr:LPS export ABC transporter periplasmic protein LptC [Allomuricauda aequoris]RIV70582.1 LPS export ABC transporter periplasmic protein LptC [Allomuricauda aequoris]TXK02013.1 LPS export ABC transporter periplasmic protein LptC [Allomuricauda aequoris]